MTLVCTWYVRSILLLLLVDTTCRQKFRTFFWSDYQASDDASSAVELRLVVYDVVVISMIVKT